MIESMLERCARLVRIDPQLLYPVKHRSAEAQADLTVIRARAALVPPRRREPKPFEQVSRLAVKPLFGSIKGPISAPQGPNSVTGSHPCRLVSIGYVRFVHTVEVAGSNPAAPTIESITYGSTASFAGLHMAPIGFAVVAQLSVSIWFRNQDATHLPGS